jgi:hypothetical protein
MLSDAFANAGALQADICQLGMDQRKVNMLALTPQSVQQRSCSKQYQNAVNVTVVVCSVG